MWAKHRALFFLGYGRSTRMKAVFKNGNCRAWVLFILNSSEISKVINVQIFSSFQTFWQNLFYKRIEIFLSYLGFFWGNNLNFVSPFRFLLNIWQKHFVFMSVCLYPSQTWHILTMVHTIMELFWRKFDRDQNFALEFWGMRTSLIRFEESTTCSIHNN